LIEHKQLNKRQAAWPWCKQWNCQNHSVKSIKVYTFY